NISSIHVPPMLPRSLSRTISFFIRWSYANYTNHWVYGKFQALKINVSILNSEYLYYGYLGQITKYTMAWNYSSATFICYIYLFNFYLTVISLVCSCYINAASCRTYLVKINLHMDLIFSFNLLKTAIISINRDSLPCFYCHH